MAGKSSASESAKTASSSSNTLNSVNSARAPPLPPSSLNPTVKLSPAMATLRTYWLPILLFLLSMIYQIFVLPNSFPLSHYDVLGIARGSSIEEVKEAFENHLSKWNSGSESPSTTDFIKIHYAFELLSNPIWKRDYDLFGIDEHLDILENIKQQYQGDSFSRVNLPLLDVGSADSHDDALRFTSLNDFQSSWEGQKALLIQICSHGSKHCSQFSSNWNRIDILVSDVANTAVVELNEFKLVSLFTEKKPTGKPFFRNGLPSLVAFPQGCRASKCLVRYEGELSVDAVTDWFSTNILHLPRIIYYSKDSLGPRFLAKSGHHKVKVIFFSDTGMRAIPFVRQIVKQYQAYASFACVLWKEEEYSFWQTVYDLESAPATVFLKDPGTKPVIYYGLPNRSWFLDVMEQHKLHELPQLRSLTSMELGCDARGYSRAGSTAMIWYCVILVGRPGPEINNMRETMRRVQEKLLSDVDLKEMGLIQKAAPSTTAVKDKRLTFAWMDGETQKNLCVFYISSELGLETCGPRRGLDDSPQLVMVRYMRNDSADDAPVKRNPNIMLDALREDVDRSAQLVARYNGPFEIPQIIEWVSNIIKDGDSSKLPFYRTKTPGLVPEDSDLFWSVGSERIFSSSNGLKHKIQNIATGVLDFLGDPRIGPLLLLGALISFGGIWLRRSQSTHPRQANQSQENNNKPKREIPKEWKNRGRITPTGDIPPSIADINPTDACQMPLSDSETE